MKWNTNLPAAAVEAIKTEAQGEPVLWAGKPDPSVAFRKGMAIWGFAIPWCAITFSVFGVMLLTALYGTPPIWEQTASKLLFTAAGLIFTGAFVLVGVAMIVAPFWARRRAWRTVYAITPKRVLTIVCRVKGGNKVTSFAPQSAVKLARSERRDGSGTLKIVLGSTRDCDGDEVETCEVWHGIADVRTPERLIESLRVARAV